MKSVKSVIAAVLVGSMVLPLAGCARKIERIRARDFESAIEEVFDDDEYGSNGGSVYVLSDHYAVNFTAFNDDDDARDTWEEALDDFDDMMDDADFDGRTRRVDRDTYGYILFDGECDDPSFMGNRDYIYGGIFYVEDEYIAVVTDKDKDSNRENVDTILEALGFPHL